MNQSVPSEAESPTPPPSRSTSPTPVLTLAPTPTTNSSNSGDQDSTLRNAKQALDHATDRLAKIDRSKLLGQDDSDYKVVAGMIKSAQQAMAEKDFLRAQSLAEKAEVLAQQLANRTPVAW